VIVDAPASGSKDPAERGQLLIPAFGPAAAADTAGPVFDIIGRKTVWLGKADRGSQRKVVVNASVRSCRGSGRDDGTGKWPNQRRRAAGRADRRCADRLMSDDDPLLRFHGIAAVRQFRLARLHPRLRELQKTESDPWARYWLSWCLAEQPTRDDPWSPAAPGYTDQPPF